MTQKQIRKLQNIYNSIMESNATDEQKAEANKIAFFSSCSRMSYEEALVRLTLAKINQVKEIYKTGAILEVFNIINQK